MSKRSFSILLACGMCIALCGGASEAFAADPSSIDVTVNVDATQTLCTMNPRRLGGTNVAMWYFGSVFASPQVHEWMSDLHAGHVRLPGGSWSNVVYWNGNGVRGADGTVDVSRVGTDGYPAVDYSGYAPSFLADPKTLHPASGNWHGHVDVKTLHEFVKAIPGTEAMACPNVGTGRAGDAAEWVRWANQTMGYNVRVWEIGNELGGAWEAGSELPFGRGPLTGEMYTKRFNEFASAMRKVDPTIKIGGGAFAEEMLRDCGTNVNFVSIHTYPGSTTLSDAQMFADIGKGIHDQVTEVRKWIRRYQPQREKEIEIAYTEWNLGFSVSKSDMFSGLWASIFLAELAKEGVAMAQQWDCFADLMDVPDNGPYARKPEYYALSLWNNYMGDRLIAANSSSPAVYTAASRSGDAVCVMLINTDHEQAANVNLRLSAFAPAEAGESATVSSREYYWNPQTRKPQWSTGPRIEQLKTGGSFPITLSPFSMTYVRIPDQANPARSSIAQRAAVARSPDLRPAELRFVMPTEVYVGDQIRGELIALAARSTSSGQAGAPEPYRGTLAPAVLSCDADVSLDRAEVRLNDTVGHFSIRPSSPGEVTITAVSGDARATQRITVKPSIPRPVVVWDFTNPRVIDTETFSSDFKLVEDLTQRANRAVARIDLPPGGAVPRDKANGLLKVSRLPDEDKLNRSNIRGVVFDLMTSPDFACDDPQASVMVVMQSSANWWMPLGNVPLNDAKQWKTQQLDIKLPDHIKAMPAALNVMFILNASKAVKGSIYFDRVGFMMR